MLAEGMDRVIEVGPEGSVIWRLRALPFHLLCRASEIWAYGNGLVHPDVCLSRRDLVFFAGAFQLPWEDKRTAGRVEVTFRASKSDKKRFGAIMTRTRVVIGNEGVGDGKDNGALKVQLDLLDIYPELDGLSMAIIVASPSWLTPAKYSSKSSRVA